MGLGAENGMTEPVVKIHKLGKVYTSGMIKKEEVVALDDFSLRIDAESPTITAIAGESSSGKTTIALLLGLLMPTSGQIRYRVRDATALSARSGGFPARGAGDRPGSVRGLQPVLSRRSGPGNGRQELRAGARKQVQGQIICKALCLDPDAVLGRFPHQLSGGQCQGS